jgi:uncharacterized membrane protein YfcA
MPPQLALGQEKLVSTLGTFSAIYNYFKGAKIIWKIVIYGIPTALIGAYETSCTITLFASIWCFNIK